MCKYGANIDEKNFKFETPLHIAGKNSSRALIETIILNGADLLTKNLKDETPLHHKKELLNSIAKP